MEVQIYCPYLYHTTGIIHTPSIPTSMDGYLTWCYSSYQFLELKDLKKHDQFIARFFQGLVHKI